MSGWYEIQENEKRQFWFVLKAGNGEVVLRSQTYGSKAAAQTGIDSVRSNCGEDERYQRLDAKDGRPYFNLMAANGQVVGTSQMYAGESARESGIASVRANGPSDDVRDGSL